MKSIKGRNMREDKIKNTATGMVKVKSKEEEKKDRKKRIEMIDMKGEVKQEWKRTKN